jgi:hypothetical protein
MSRSISRFSLFQASLIAFVLIGFVVLFFSGYPVLALTDAGLLAGAALIGYLLQPIRSDRWAAFLAYVILGAAYIIGAYLANKAVGAPGVLPVMSALICSSLLLMRSRRSRRALNPTA